MVEIFWVVSPFSEYHGVNVVGIKLPGGVPPLAIDIAGVVATW